MSWNSVIATYDTKKKKAVKGLVNQRGNPITIISGNVIVKSVILEIKQKIDKPIVFSDKLQKVDFLTILVAFLPNHH